MIHVENAPVADAAMVASVWLPNIAHFTISTPFGIISHVEAPVGRYNARICDDAFVEGEQEIAEEHMKDKKYEHRICVWNIRKPYKPHKASMNVTYNAQNHADEAHPIHALRGEWPNAMHA
jgi:hypothetical protein